MPRSGRKRLSAQADLDSATTFERWDELDEASKRYWMSLSFVDGM